jgi:hypothetical protein
VRAALFALLVLVGCADNLEPLPDGGELQGGDIPAGCADAIADAQTFCLGAILAAQQECAEAGDEVVCRAAIAAAQAACVDAFADAESVCTGD